MANKDRMIKNGEIIVEDERKRSMGTGAPIRRSVSIDAITGLRPLSNPVPQVVVTTGNLPGRRRLTRARLLMPQQVGTITREEISRRTLPGLKTMPTVRGDRRPQGKLKDQVPLRQEPTDAVKEGYVRLRLEARDGEIRVVGVKHVDGALTQPQRVRSGLVYEVVRRGKRVAMGQIPDSGQKRSFPHPDPKPGQEGHAISELPEVRFTARIPASEFSASKVPQLDISLLRVKAAVRKDIIGTEPLRQQFPQELRDVATLHRIREADLPRSVARELRAVLRQ
jgi:hypothetical protein